MSCTRLSRIAICLTLFLFLGACEVPGPDRNLRYAADVPEARQAIAEGAQVNRTDPVGQTPLIIQARQGHLAVVKFLIDHGAKLDMVDGTGGSALSEAYHEGNQAVVALLLDSGAYPTIAIDGQNVTLSTLGLKAKALADAYVQARQGGCVGRPLDACVRNLHAAFGFNIASYDDVLKRNDAVDVNGKPIRPEPSLEITGTFTRLNGETSDETASIRYGADKAVDSVSMTLLADPETANMTTEYDATGLYEAFVMLLGTDCPAITKDQVYKFFQNQVKPKLVGSKDFSPSGAKGGDISSSNHASGIPFCGRKFSFDRTEGYHVRNVRYPHPRDRYWVTTIAFE